MDKWCGNCDYFQCNRIENTISYCNKWPKRDKELKLESKNKDIFKFKKIGDWE